MVELLYAESSVLNPFEFTISLGGEFSENDLFKSKSYIIPVINTPVLLVCLELYLLFINDDSTTLEVAIFIVLCGISVDKELILSAAHSVPFVVVAMVVFI